jgi:hypothetical protein
VARSGKSAFAVFLGLRVRSFLSSAMQWELFFLIGRVFLNIFCEKSLSILVMGYQQHNDFK